MKIYQKPNTEVVAVEINNLMAVSNDGEGKVNSVTVSTDEYDGRTPLGRENSIWDDEE